MRVVLTGGAGFIGSHLAERLLGDGHDVVCVDDLSSGRWTNVAPLETTGRFTFVRADVVEALPVEGPVDRLYHLASPVSLADPAARPIQTLRTCAEGTRRCLDMAADRGATFVLASTSDIYGEPEVHPQRETYPGLTSSVGPRSAYTEGKRYAEALATAYARERGVGVRIARIFNTYGPRMRPGDGRVVPAFVAAAVAGRPLRIHGSGRQTRSFCYVADMVEGLVRLAEADAPGAEAPVNLGNEDEVAVLDLAREIMAIAGSDAPVEHVAERPGDPVRRRPDLTRARALLGWEPRVSRDQGLRETIAFMQQERAAG